MRQDLEPDRYALLRTEREEFGVGSEVLREIRDAITPVAKRWPPTEMFMRQQISGWTPDLEDDLVFDFAEHLLHGRLTRIFDSATDVGGFRLLLRVSARQFLSNRRRGTEGENLRRRAEEILETSDWAEAQADGLTRCWVAQGHRTGGWEPLDEGQLRALAWSLQVPASVRRSRRDTVIASRVLTNKDLAALLRELLERAAQPLNREQIRRVLEERLGLRPAQTVSTSWSPGDSPTIEDILGEPSRGLDDIHARVVAGDVASILSLRQLRILGQMFALGRSRDATARSVGVSHGTISNELGRVGRILLQQADGDMALARRALEFIVERSAE